MLMMRTIWEKLILAITARGLYFKLVVVYRNMIRLHFSDESTNELFMKYCSFLYDVTKGVSNLAKLPKYSQKNHRFLATKLDVQSSGMRINSMPV